MWAGLFSSSPSPKNFFLCFCCLFTLVSAVSHLDEV